MKKLLTLALASLIAPFAWAQLPNSGGPDAFGYTFKNSNHSTGPSYQWFDITQTGIQVTGLSDDNFVGPFSISGFTYYTNTPTQFWIGSNGYIAFNAVNIASSAASFPAIPTAGGPNGFIAPFMSDLTFGGASSNPGKVYRYDQGDTVCISFENVPFWVNNANQYGGDNSFQVILNRADSSITFNYQKQVGAPDPVYQNNYISIGIEDNTGNNGLQYYRGDTINAIISTTVKYEMPSIVQPVTDVAINWVDNDKNAAKFIPVGSSFTPVANIKNTGNQNVNGTISISYTIENSFGSLVGLGFTSLNGLSNGQDTTLVLGNTYTPNASEKFVFTTYLTGVTGDNIQTNDTNRMFFKSVDTTLMSQDLDYSDGLVTLGGLGWSGGNGGVACYFEPPYYPARIKSSKFYITTLGSPPTGFYSKIYDDGGRFGPQGALLDSVLVSSGTITTGTYTTVPTVNNVVINSGGVFLLWLMQADGINIARSRANPASRQTYEVLFGSWSNYRSLDSEDFLMGLEVEPVAVGIEENEEEKLQAVYPNPATDQVFINTGTKLIDRNELRVFTAQGQQVDAKLFISEGQIRVMRSNLPAGTYYLNYKRTNTKLVFID